jgi:hypothetical protein
MNVAALPDGIWNTDGDGSPYKQLPSELAEDDRLPDVDLGALAATGIPPPELICKDMLYAGGIHTIAGQPGGGKTTLMAWWMLQHIRAGGRVMLLDEESGPEMVAEKFLDLGAHPDELRPPGLNYIPFPGRGWNIADLQLLHERVAERQPGIIAWDSVAEFLTIADADENSASEVTRFWKRVLKPLARDYGAAVIAADHTGKDAEHGGYGRGSGAKKAASDVQYIVETVKPFNRTQDGLLKLTTSPGKDRRGWLGAGYQVRVSVDPVLALDITEQVRDESGMFRPTVLMGRVCDALTQAGSMTFRDIKSRVRGKEEGLRQAIAALIDEGNVKVYNGPRGAHIHELVVPFED